MLVINWNNNLSRLFQNHCTIDHSPNFHLNFLVVSLCSSAFVVVWIFICLAPIYLTWGRFMEAITTAHRLRFHTAFSWSQCAVLPYTTYKVVFFFSLWQHRCIRKQKQPPTLHTETAGESLTAPFSHQQRGLSLAHSSHKNAASASLFLS